MRSYVSGSVLGVLPGDLNGHAASGGFCGCCDRPASELAVDRKSTRLNSSHSQISYAVFCLKKKKKQVSAASSRARYFRHFSVDDDLLGIDNPHRTRIVPIRDSNSDTDPTKLYTIQ